MAAAAPENAPTFNWTGPGAQEGAHIHYASFNFAGQHYALGECVYLLPEEEGAPPYIARLVRAYEDTTAKEVERLVIEVQWFERRGSLPASVGGSMHEAEVVESDLVDTNLVGCLDSKALILRANSYEEAVQLLPPGFDGEWHFCRGMWDSEAQRFKTYAEMGAVAAYPHAEAYAASGNGYSYAAQLAAYPAAATADGGHAMQEEPDGEQQQQQQANGRGSGRGRGRRARAASARVAAVTAAAGADVGTTSSGGTGGVLGGGGGGGGGTSSRGHGSGAALVTGNGYPKGIPGKVCCECGATVTPQWREGPKGPKTLCNACGVRYQRQQNKAKTNKRVASERGAGKERAGSPAATSGRSAKQARLSAAAAAAATAAAAAVAAGADAGGDAVMADADGDSHQHHHGTRRNSGKGAGSAAGTGRGRGGRGGRGGRNAAAAAAAAAAGAGSSGDDAPPTVELAGSSSRLKLAHPALAAATAAAAAAAAAAGEQLGFYADEGSPPNMNTKILEYPEDDEQQQQQAQQQAANGQQAAEQQAQPGGGANSQQPNQQQQLGRSATNEAADTLQNLAGPSAAAAAQAAAAGPGGAKQQPGQAGGQQQQPGQQQQQQHPQHPAVSAGGLYSMLNSPATMLMAAEQGMNGEGMPLLSLDEKYRPGTPSGLAGPDGLDGLHPHSLSPIQHRGGSATGGAGGSAAPRFGYPGAASPGRLISRMVQNLSGQPMGGLAAGLSPLGPITSLGLPAGSLGQSAQPTGGMLSELLAGAAGGGGSSNAAAAPAGGSNGQQQPGAQAGGSKAGQQQAQDCGASNGQPGENQLLSNLRSMLFRASVYTPDVHGLSGLYPGPSTPRSLQQLVGALECLPEAAKQQLADASASIEDNLSKAKAAEAAVLAVSQVLATKQEAAAEARASVERAVLHLRSALVGISPQIAAAAAGNGCSDAAATAAANAAAAVSAADAAAAAAATAAANAAGAAMAGSGFMGQVVGEDGTAATAAPSSQGMSYTDDLLRDPYFADDVPGGAAPGAAAAAAVAIKQEVPDAPPPPKDDQQQQQQQHPVKLEGEGAKGGAAAGAPPAAANGTSLSAGETATVAA